MKFSMYNVCQDNFLTNGDGEIRTLDPLLARQVLSQLSYTPIYVYHIFRMLYSLFNYRSKT